MSRVDTPATRGRAILLYHRIAEARLDPQLRVFPLGRQAERVDTHKALHAALLNAASCH